MASYKTYCDCGNEIRAVAKTSEHFFRIIRRLGWRENEEGTFKCRWCNEDIRG